MFQLGGEIQLKRYDSKLFNFSLLIFAFNVPVKFPLFSQITSSPWSICKGHKTEAFWLLWCILNLSSLKLLLFHLLNCLISSLALLSVLLTLYFILCEHDNAHSFIIPSYIHFSYMRQRNQMKPCHTLISVTLSLPLCREPGQASQLMLLVLFILFNTATLRQHPVFLP